MEATEKADPVVRVKEYLEAAGYKGKIMFTEDTIFTVEDASRAVGAPPEEILKSLVFMADDKPVLVLMSGANQVHSRKVKKLLEARKIRMASPDYVFEYSGYHVGGVPPVGYPEQLPVILDDDIYNYEVVWAAAGTDHAFFPISPEELQRITGGVRGDVKKEPKKVKEK